jgi:heme exporter protein C
MHRFANPARFLRLAAALESWLVGALAILLAVGLYLALAASPPDYQQGETVRIMYVHVPSAWMAMFVYSCLAVASFVALVWKHPLADVAAKSMAPIGACFTALCLITGSLWGRPMWGTWWVWDARLTSVLILFFLYLGHIALTNAFDDPRRGERAAALLALVGAVNVPIIKFSVDWWNTLHQPASVTRLDGPALHPSMLWPLLIMALAFSVYFALVLIWRMRAELAERRVRNLTLARAEAASTLASERA